MKPIETIIAEARAAVERAKQSEAEMDKVLRKGPKEIARLRGSLSVSIRWDHLDAILQAIEAKESEGK